MAVRRTSTVAERELWPTFPFLPGAEQLVKEFAPSLRDLLSDPSFERARELGRARIRSAVDDPTGTSAVEELGRTTPEERFLSFFFARVLLSSLPAGPAIRRWAVAEAKRGSAALDTAELDQIREVAERLDFTYDTVGSQFDVPVPDYIRLATPIREADFRLVRQAVSHGKVRVSRARASRLLQEAVRLRLAQPISLAEPVRVLIRETEGEFLDEVVRRLPTPKARDRGFGPLLPDRFPPCIRKMRRMLESGENLSHSGRFALAAFLHRAGADFETIVDAYRGAPDFDEGTTRYQVEHITRRDEGRGYSVPSCDTLRSHGLCFREGDPTAPRPQDRAADALCHEERLRSPIQYYGIRGGRPPPTEEPVGATSGSTS